MFKVKEIFHSLQGEGFHSGRPAVFCRFSNCNLACNFCDTDFIGTNGNLGDEYGSAEILVEKILQVWKRGTTLDKNRFVVLTGGEPLLQVNDHLVKLLQDNDFFVAIETNGTLPVPKNVGWVCVSPKSAKPFLTNGNELKLVYPQVDMEPDIFLDLDFDHFYLQPLFSDEVNKNSALAVKYCLENPMWKLSLQTQKFLGID